MKSGRVSAGAMRKDNGESAVAYVKEVWCQEDKRRDRGTGRHHRTVRGPSSRPHYQCHPYREGQRPSGRPARCVRRGAAGGRLPVHGRG